MDMDTVKMIGGVLLRHALSGGAVALAADGWISSSMTEQFIGAGMFLGALAWSGAQKYGNVLISAAVARAHGVHPKRKHH